jgi:hypothetical protein
MSEEPPQFCTECKSQIIAMTEKFSEEIIHSGNHWILAADVTPEAMTVRAIEEGYEPGSTIESDPIVVCVNCEKAIRNAAETLSKPS